MSPRTSRQNEEIREQTRKQVQQAAFELFARKGFAHTTIHAIAQKAGVSKGLIYHYFNSKDEILEAIFEELAKMGDAALAFSEGLNSSQQFKKILEMTFGYIREATETVRLMVSVAIQPEAVAKLKPLIDRYNARQIELMKPLFSDLGYSEPETEAYYLAAKLDGISLGYITLGEEYPFEAIKKKLLKEYLGEYE